MKTGSCDEIIDFCRNLMKFSKILFFDKRKVAFVVAKFFGGCLS